mmetsp:Transcript_3822/g.5552  ORF Transcript_3822/g.5552 Transcript_3822/m.5552 type:complete len:219 (-) Transcript_3822:81-737(-)
MFRPCSAVREEMDRLQTLRTTQPEYAKQIMLQNDNLVELAAAGLLESIVSIVLTSREDEVLTWTGAKMFKAACLNGHIHVVKFMGENGLDRRHPGLVNILHYLMEETEDEMNLLKVIPVLVAQDFDINDMRRSDSYTPLHLVCKRGFINLFKLLVTLGADVHAIANDNSMPINCALELAENATTTQQVVSAGNIVTYLRRLGAQESVSGRVTYVSSRG